MTIPDLRGKKILITGGMGFIGSNVAELALASGAEVTLFDILDPKSGGNHENVTAICPPAKILIQDIRNFESVCQAVIGVDAVIHCAAYTSHPGSMKEPLEDIDINCKGTIHLLEALRRFRPEARMVYVGTSTQIGRMQRPVIDETHPEFPVDVYSASKSAGEKYTLLYGKAFSDMNTTVVRLANNFGPRSNIRNPDFGFINFFVGLALQGKDITVFGEGKQLRNVSFVSDSARALLLAAVRPEAKGEVFFSVADQQYPVIELAQAISRVIGGGVRQIPWPPDRAAIEVGDAVISNQKIKTALGWTPQTDLESGLARTRDYFTPRLRYYL